VSRRFQDHLEQAMTTPIVNVISYASPHYKRWEKQYKELCLVARGALHGDRDLVAFHKKALGRHKGCFTAEFRHWVWEGDGWRVFVSNLKGIGFEVAVHLKPTEALAAWADYRSKAIARP